MTERSFDDVDRCEQLRPALDDLVLHDLEPGERAKLSAHVEGCADCRAEFDALTEVVARVADLAPAVEPPTGFVDRVVAAHAGAGAEHDGSPPVVVSGLDPRAPHDAAGGAEAPRDVRRWLVVAVAAAVLILGGVVGVAVGRSLTDPDARVVALDRVGVVDVRSGVLGAGYGRTGTVVVTGGADPTLVMTLDQVEPGVTYGCALRTADGQLVPVGSWTPATANDRTWAVAVGPVARGASEVVLTGPDGTRLASAELD